MLPITAVEEGLGEKELESATIADTAEACASIEGHNIATASMKGSTVSSQRALSLSQNVCAHRGWCPMSDSQGHPAARNAGTRALCHTRMRHALTAMRTRR